MTALDLIVRGALPPAQVPLTEVSGSHGVSAGASRMYGRFFGQEKVLIHPSDHAGMLEDALVRMVAERPDLRQRQGVAVYAKTQTHNTPFEADWLNALFARIGLAGWEVLTLSMTNCASSLAAVHAFGQDDRPLIVISGEKAFHITGNRLAVGLLGEAPLAALFDGSGSRPVVASRVHHLPRFHLNPDDMDPADKHALQSAFEDGFGDFVAGCLASHPDFFARRPVIVPYNLNVPLVQRLLDRFDLTDQVFEGHSGRFGHTFCSDNFLNLAQFPTDPSRPVFLFCAGMGVTYAAVLLDAVRDISKTHQSTPPKGDSHV